MECRVLPVDVTSERRGECQQRQRGVDFIASLGWHYRYYASGTVNPRTVSSDDETNDRRSKREATVRVLILLHNAIDTVNQGSSASVKEFATRLSGTHLPLDLRANRI